jgi:hypothetical protein
MGTSPDAMGADIRPVSDLDNEDGAFRGYILQQLAGTASDIWPRRKLPETQLQNVQN